MKNLNIIGIHYGHNATAALMQNGELVCAISEERLNRIKNSTGLPSMSIDYIKNKFTTDIDYYVLSQRFSWGYNFLKKRNFESSSYTNYYSNLNIQEPWLQKLIPDYSYKRQLRTLLDQNKKEELNEPGREELLNYFSNFLKTSRDKIILLDHHLAHTYSTLLFNKNLDEDKLIFTLDGEGDGLCATINIWSNGKIKTISTTNRAFSIGYLYREMTAFLGMKPDEHEFKVMGLAPYAKEEWVKKLLPFFQKLLWLNNKDEFESAIPMTAVRFFIKKNLTYQRFDNLAGAIQKFTEELVLDWVNRWIKKTEINNVAIAGGVFMNVKLNQKIAELDSVKSLTVVPSAGDESTALGACLYGQKLANAATDSNLDIKYLNNLYLGTSFNDEKIEKILKDDGYFEKYLIKKSEHINEDVARLLADNEVVARFSSKMEFGARALGNRSILANPSSYENVHLINEMIKCRDFWMPFATTIIDEDENRYLFNHKKMEAPFMSVTFNTTKEAQHDLPAALHPYDKTSRPQILSKIINPDYYQIISEFKKLTGIGAVLNTSFNLHGEPNVESPQDALNTLENSGLKFLALGNFLIQKK